MTITSSWTRMVTTRVPTSSNDNSEGGYFMIMKRATCTSSSTWTRIYRPLVDLPLPMTTAMGATLWQYSEKFQIWWHECFLSVCQWLQRWGPPLAVVMYLDVIFTIASGTENGKSCCLFSNYSTWLVLMQLMSKDQWLNLFIHEKYNEKHAPAVLILHGLKLA